jgi:hypothetical protein
LCYCRLRTYSCAFRSTWSTRKFRLTPVSRILCNEFAPILKSASRRHSSTVPLPTLASSNLGALSLVGWAPRSAANVPLTVPPSRESRRNESGCTCHKGMGLIASCPHVSVLAYSTRGGHAEKPSATQQQSPSPHASTSRSAHASVAWQARARQNVSPSSLVVAWLCGMLDVTRATYTSARALMAYAISCNL